MCGIFGCVGESDIIDKCVNGLKKLEYRGYDSSGIAYFYENEIKIVKKTGKISKLEKEIKKRKIISNNAIMHTRWATHGKVCEVNAHPHISSDNKIAIVHNGIIENYLELKQKYNIKCVSQTDSEIIACLIEKSNLKTNLEKLREVCSVLVGSYALAILFKDEPDKIYVAKNKSPVVVGHFENTCYVCSDANALSDYCKTISVLKDNTFAILTNSEIEIYNNNLERQNMVNISIINNLSETCARFHSHFMLKEINEVPYAINNTIDKNNYNVIDNIFKKIKFNTNFQFIIIGCGTAYHAGLMGVKYFGEIGINAHCYIASEFRYDNVILSKNTIAIFISQSGETADTLACVELCKKKKIKTLAITNVRYSSITKLCDNVLYTYAGSEIAVASTKAYNAQLTLLILLKNYIKIIKKHQKNDIFYQNECKKIKNSTKYLLSKEIIDKAKQLANKYKKTKKFIVIGRQKDYITSKETALKIREITYKNCCSFASGELKHGTIALIDKKSVVICFATNKKMLQKSLVALEEVSCRGAKTILVTLSNFNIDESKYDEVIKIKSVNSNYQELLNIEIMQLFAYYLCLKLKLDPDKPRNLAKSVTVE